jgi:uncharacterized protein YdaU (DUF1376 family)
MTTKSPAFQWYPKDILASARVQMMTLAEEGAYRRLLDFCWINGSVPADPQKAARLIGKGCSVEIAKTALEMFEVHPTDPEKMIHERLEIEREKQESNSEARRKASAARWNKQGTSENGNGKQVKSKADANALQTDMQNDALHIASSSSSSEVNNNGGGGSTRAPAREQANPPTAAESPPKYESLPEYLLRKQLEYPMHDVQKIHDDFVAKIESGKYPLLKNTRRHFDKWLSEQDVEFEAEKPKDWRKGIDECDKCDKRGLIKTEKGMQKCRHENDNAS